MVWEPRRKPGIEKAADLIRDAGGKIIGRTRLQKIAYLLEIAGVGDGFAFAYRHYGPFSETLAAAIRQAESLGLIHEEENETSWGGFYSVFTASPPRISSGESARSRIIDLAKDADPVELELAATAAFLATEGHTAVWHETAKRKPEKANSVRLANAKALYGKLLKINAPKQLPKIS